MKFYLAILLWLSAFTVCAELRYQTYAGTGARPCQGCTTPLSSGTAQNINYNWGGGSVLDTGRSDWVVVKFWGYLTVPGSGTKTVTFYGYHDDGFTLNLDGVRIINNWNEQGAGFWNSVASVQLEGGRTYALEAWYYENGGGAGIQLYWDVEGQIDPIDSRYYTIQPPQPQYCCGGTAAEFQQQAEHATVLTNWINRPLENTSVYITQVGNGNSTTVEQSGTWNNAIVYESAGNNNTVSIQQNATTTAAAHYSSLVITGNTNTVNITQSGISGTKSAFVRIVDHNNAVTITQSGAGSHYASVDVLDSNKTVSVTQSGNVAHTMRIELSGGSTAITAIQRGATPQFYSITHACSQATCQPITVTQGR